jgi:holo-[acyl-carrier protein] synthase
MPPPIPFPYPLRIGTDICRVARIAHILRSKQASRFIRRVLAPEELARAKPAIHQVLEAAAQARRSDGSGLHGVGVMRGGEALKGSGRKAEETEDGEVGPSDLELNEAGEKKARSEEGFMYGRAATYLAGR